MFEDDPEEIADFERLVKNFTPGEITEIRVNENGEYSEEHFPAPPTIIRPNIIYHLLANPMRFEASDDYGKTWKEMPPNWQADAYFQLVDFQPSE